uniref:WGS project CAEQ00000000 data, annotated contig 235 n=1 Tax=Trypanosoma congolense (strain IL3000) TaxID=1068625 RepID=F9WDC4_TRYCI|nr:unnamed protein product [Trypanosoma congolense IL3000]
MLRRRSRNVFASAVTMLRMTNCTARQHATGESTENDAGSCSEGGTQGTSGNGCAETLYRDRLISEILSRDKEIFELKRQHELSMLRVEQNQRRVLKDQEDRGMYYEQNCNVHTFDTVSVGLYTQRNTLYHTMSIERLRNVKLFTTVLVTVLTCFYFYYRYMINDDWVYVQKPMRLLGSRVGALAELREQMEEEQLGRESQRGLQRIS